MPEVGSEPQAVRRQLERVLASPGFFRNERLSRFLRFIVEEHLEGKDTELKESVVALEVFGRPDHDPQQDSIVRTEASRLRARLAEYYLGVGKDDPFIIELPKGGYVPVTRSAGRILAANPGAVGPGSRFKGWIIGAVVAVVIVLTAAGWWSLSRQSPPIPIAVLPLANLNQDPANDFYADGLTGEIIRNLSIIEGLTVRSESSSFAFKGKPLKAQDAGRQLEADYLVEGSVLRSGQQLRISAQLVRASDDFPLWSGRYDRELTDIFAIQDEISRAIVNSLRLKLGGGRRRYETSTEAYDLYLRARTLQRKHDGELGESIPIFEQAIVKDASFAPAYAGLAVAHLSLSGQAGSADGIPSEIGRMRAAAEKAIQLDPLSAEASDALGAACAREAQWEPAAKNFRRSMEIQPGRVESHGNFAIYYLLPLGRIEEAIRHLRIAENSDPTFTFFLGDALADVGRNEEASSVCDKLSPDDSLKNQCVPGALVRQGKANEVIEKYGSRPANPAWVEGALACAYARAGRREEAEQAAALSGRSYRPSAFACIGDKDRVFEALDRAVQFGPIRMGWLLLRVDREHPGLLRGDPRLQALRKRVGLPE
jgi:TolB-like protein